MARKATSKYAGTSRTTHAGRTAIAVTPSPDRLSASPWPPVRARGAPGIPRRGARARAYGASAPGRRPAQIASGEPGPASKRAILGSMPSTASTGTAATRSVVKCSRWPNSVWIATKNRNRTQRHERKPQVRSGSSGQTFVRGAAHKSAGSPQWRVTYVQHEHQWLGRTQQLRRQSRWGCQPHDQAVDWCPPHRDTTGRRRATTRAISEVPGRVMIDVATRRVPRPRTDHDGHPRRQPERPGVDSA